MDFAREVTLIPPPKNIFRSHPHYEDCARVFHQACAHWLTTKSKVPFGVILTRQNRAKLLEYPTKFPEEPVIEWLLHRIRQPARERAFGLCYRADVQAQTGMTVLVVAVQHTKGGSVLNFYVPEDNPQRWWVEEGADFLNGQKRKPLIGQ